MGAEAEHIHGTIVVSQSGENADCRTCDCWLWVPNASGDKPWKDDNTGHHPSGTFVFDQDSSLRKGLKCAEQRRLLLIFLRQKIWVYFSHLYSFKKGPYKLIFIKIFKNAN